MTKYLKTADQDWYKQRLARIAFCVAGTFCLIFIRLFYLQVINGEELRRLSENNCIRLQSTDPSRGMIFDRNGIRLVDNRPSFDLNIVLKDAKPVEQTVKKLSKYINVPESELLSKIENNKTVSSYKPILLKKDIGRDALAAIEVRKFDLPGVIVDVKPRRHYLERQTAAHLIGYLSEINADELNSGEYPGYTVGDYIGKFGIEKIFESFLQGKRGGRQVEVNVMGQVVRNLKTVDPQPGQNLYLTIDLRVQKKAEALLEGVAGAVVAMDPQTGQILALASSPSFDQNIFVDGMSHEQWDALVSNPLRPLENKVIHGEYPPASTFKIITAIAALEEGVIDKDTTFYCPGYYKYGNRVYRCWRAAGHDSVNVIKALAESCDVYFYQVGQKLGIDRLSMYAVASGLGSPTGIDLDHEAAGLIPTKEWKKRRTGVAWQGGETLSVAIGQGFDLATPLQMLVLTSAVANGGEMYKPLILKSVYSPEGSVILESKKQLAGKLPVSKKTLKIIKEGLWNVVNNKKGTAWIAHVEGFDISGKTGTAQVVGRSKERGLSEEELSHRLKSHAWFVAYAPSVDPQIAVSVIVEHGSHGSSTAAPIARDVIKTYFGQGENSTPDKLKVAGDQ
ncbi:MAG: penicillin-binding protein 2 [Desulfobacteraceae bacterium]|nr:penicillin-binding protein 2 [Desulfobacteraceae bacterium]MDH3574246.1 penicillin-binding protein 2 [Desulfobacteraceae bacterium]MDH3720927.1 penicillin-binding protein 2 [Desulfobacteraceae bacterium]MDH3836247.1 penicillin-binding protein 2 [Desulfobacteraceae bacterium]MDH3874327.1 penicillin-binding protein 2 [Desulfobacteraceae bacterium]